MDRLTLREKGRPICFFIDSLTRGGAERAFTMIASEFIRRGHSVDFVVGTDRLALVDELHEDINRFFFRKNRLLNAFPRFLKYLRDRMPACVFSTLHHCNFTAIACNYLLGKITKVYVQVPTNVAREERTGTNLVDRLSPFLIRFLYPVADRVICVSEGGKNGLKEIGLSESNLTVIPNTINVRRVRQRARECAPDHPVFDQPDPVLVTAGRLEKEKDHETLIRAVNELIRSRTVRLLILGEGNKRKELELTIRKKQLEDHVYLTGEVENPYPYFAESDLFVLSSLWEGMPTVILEALALGKTVVSTDCESGPGELLEDGRYGYLTPPANPSRLARTINHALEHPLDPAPLKNRAEEFSVQRITDQFQQLVTAQRTIRS